MIYSDLQKRKYRTKYHCFIDYYEADGFISELSDMLDTDVHRMHPDKRHVCIRYTN